MNKSEIQSRIEKCESDLATLKADLAKCEDGIEQEKCWHGIIGHEGYVNTLYPGTRRDIEIDSTNHRAAYMPECRQVTADDVRAVFQIEDGTISHDEFAKRAHKLGFRMKVTP